jgi:hypothetical protein
MKMAMATHENPVLALIVERRLLVAVSAAEWPIATAANTSANNIRVIGRNATFSRPGRSDSGPSPTLLTQRGS